jgi:2-haloacid dehalogenase
MTQVADKDRNSLARVKALTFDTGGTVLDWHSGIRSALSAAGERHGLVRDWAAITNTYRRRSLQRMTGQVRPAFNIDDVHRSVLDELIDEYELGVLSEADRAAIARQWHSLDAWPDFPAALQRLRSRYVAVSFTILSVSLIIDTARRNRLQWDAVISCEMLGVYKPRADAYRHTARLLQLDCDEILMIACHNFDLDAARGVGYRTCFVRRPEEWGATGPPDPVPNAANDLSLDSFAELPERMGA